MATDDDRPTGDDEPTESTGPTDRTELNEPPMDPMEPMGPLIDAAGLVGLLADADRRRVIAALILGADTQEGVRQATGLELRPTMNALWRLVDAGLVEALGDGTYVLFESAFRAAAVAAARSSPSEPELELDATADPSSQTARVLRAFVRGSQLIQIPAQRSKRLVVLDLLAQEFEPGERYPERTVNQVLRRWHPDTAALRRYLVDEGFLERAGGEYWRAGGTYLPD